MNLPYLKQTIKSNAGVWAAFTVILCLFLTVMTIVFTPANMESISGMAEGSFIGNMIGGSTLIAFMANSYYAVMAIIFPMLYSILTGNGLIAKKIDNGSMTGYLSTPVSRGKIVCTSAVFLIGSLATMWLVVTVVGLVVSAAAQPGELDRALFLKMNLGAFLYHFAISSVCFAASCFFNLSGRSLLVGGGVSLFCFIVSLLVKLSPDLDWMKYLTLNTLFDTKAVLQGEHYLPGFLALAVIGICLYSAGIAVFQKKNLPL